MKRDVLTAVVLAKAAKRAAVLFTPIAGEPSRSPAAPPDASAAQTAPRSEHLWIQGEGDLATDLRDAALRALATDDSFTIETADGPVFVQPINPPLRLFVVGAVHIAEPLAKMASLLGYEVALLDPRAAFARAERWPGITVRTEWPDEVLDAAHLDHRAAVVTLTPDPKIDDPALESALRSTAFYIGALGSGKTHGSRLRRLAERGFSEEALARIHGPVGLRIGARTPAEIATSIVAQITETLRRGPDPDKGAQRRDPVAPQGPRAAK